MTESAITPEDWEIYADELTRKTLTIAQVAEITECDEDRVLEKVK